MLCDKYSLKGSFKLYLLLHYILTRDLREYVLLKEPKSGHFPSVLIATDNEGVMKDRKLRCIKLCTLNIIC